MRRLLPSSTRTDTLFPYTTLFLSEIVEFFREPTFVDRRLEFMCAGNRLALKHPSDAKTRTTGRVVDHGPRSAEAPLGFVGEPAHAELAFAMIGPSVVVQDRVDARSEAHTSELQSLMRIAYAVFCLKTKI